MKMLKNAFDCISFRKNAVKQFSDGRGLGQYGLDKLYYMYIPK